MFAVHSRITVLVVALVSICGATQVSLEAYATAFDTVPIAVVPFESRGASRLTSNEPWVVIAADLSFSPRFKVHRASKPDSAKLLDKGIGIYVDGEYTIEGQHVVLECFLRDARNGQELLGKKLRGETKYVRSMAHRFANDIIEALLGERSVFESRMLFVRKHGDTKDLYIMDYDGHGTKRLTNTKTVNVFPAFADGNTIVWTSFLRGKH